MGWTREDVINESFQGDRDKALLDVPKSGVCPTGYFKGQRRPGQQIVGNTSANRDYCFPDLDSVTTDHWVWEDRYGLDNNTYTFAQSYVPTNTSGAQPYQKVLGTGFGRHFIWKEDCERQGGTWNLWGDSNVAHWGIKFDRTDNIDQNHNYFGSDGICTFRKGVMPRVLQVFNNLTNQDDCESGGYSWEGGRCYDYVRQDEMRAQINRFGSTGVKTTSHIIENLEDTKEGIDDLLDFLEKYGIYIVGGVLVVLVLTGLNEVKEFVTFR